MEALIAIVIAAIAVVAAVGAIFIMLRMANRRQEALGGDLERIVDGLQTRQGEMEARLRADQGTLSERLHAQELKLSKTLEEGLHSATKQTLETMGKLERRLAAIDQAQANIVELSTQVVGLQDILANKQARGAFGEIQLADLVRQMLPPSAYSFQATLSNNRRADCLLQLPNPPGPIVIDAKFPLESYHALRNAASDAEKTAAARAFQTAIQTHVKHIAERYLVPGETADAALMFLPSEAVYAELHGNFPNAVETSYRARVFIVSPTTLWATLNTVRAVLKDVRMREQAGFIQAQARALHDDVTRLSDRVDKLARHFEQAGDTIRNIRISADKVAQRSQRMEAVELAEEEEADTLDTRPDGPQGADLFAVPRREAGSGE